MTGPAVARQPPRRPAKAAAAFRIISEVASDLDVPSHVLRFWETKFSQVRPLKRGGGRRYYRPEDVDLLRRIRALLYEDGYTIKGVQKLLREGAAKPPTPAPPAPSGAAAAAARGAAVGGGPRAVDGGGLDAATRDELRSVLGELEALRELLRGEGN
jgi:DNA-binding transcriptional MerR regulator